MLELDLEQFWKDDELAHKDNCFSPDSPQTALGIRMSNECVYAELGAEGKPWGPLDPILQRELNLRYNDLAEKIVGKRLLPEVFESPEEQFPYVKRIGEVFEGSYVYKHDTEWLTQSVSEPEELEAMLDRVDALDIRHFMLPDNWEEEKKRIFETYGKKPPLMRHIRGPVTLACSIMGSENLIYLIMDDPDLAERFSRTITRVTLEMAAVMDEEAGVTANSRRGFSFADDNCCLLNPAMYELFGYPVLKTVFEHYSPDPDDSRYQHSDSAMEHLLPILGRLNFTGVNFGPTVHVPAIRKYMPHTMIEGCLAPFTFMYNDEDKIREEIMRDLADDKTYRGVNIFTAGSINNGSRLSSMRYIMALIQNYGRLK